MRLLAVWLAPLLLAACTGSLFQSKEVPAAVYWLSAKPAPGGAAAARPMAAPTMAADLAVLRPHVRAGLESDRVAVLYPDRRLDYFAGARWSGPLDQVVQDLAIQAFQSGSGMRNVSGDSSAFASGYWLELEILDFQAEYPAGGTAAPTIHVRLSAKIGNASTRRVLGTIDAESRRPAADNRLTAIIDAFESAANEALARVVVDAAGQLGALSVGR